MQPKTIQIRPVRMIFTADLVETLLFGGPGNDALDGEMDVLGDVELGDQVQGGVDAAPASTT